MRIQEAKGIYSSGTSFTVDLPNSPADGNALILTVHISKDSVTPVTVSSVSSTGASWALVQAQTKDDGSSLAVDTEIWAALDLSGALGPITITLSGVALAAGAFAFEESEIAASSAVDQTASNSGDADTTVDSGTTAATAEDNELAIAALTSTSAYTFAGTPTNGFDVIDQEIGFSLSGEACEKTLTAIDTVNTSDSTDPYEGIWAGCVATFLFAAAPTPPDKQPAQYSGIQPVLDFRRKDEVQKYRTRLSVRAPPFPIIPPASFNMATPRMYSGITTVLDYLALQHRRTWPRKLTVQPPVFWTYSFTVSDTATGTDAVTIGLALSDSAHGTDALASLTAQLTVADAWHGTDALQALTSTFTVNDVAVGFDAVITPAIIGTVSISIISQPIDIQVQGRTVDVLLTGRTVTVTVEPS